MNNIFARKRRRLKFITITTGIEFVIYYKTFKMKTLLIFAAIAAIGIVIGYYSIVEKTLPEEL